jgi:hypothetical protein
MVHPVLLVKFGSIKKYKMGEPCSTHDDLNKFIHFGGKCHIDEHLTQKECGAIEPKETVK